jgi:hypothetical protein
MSFYPPCPISFIFLKLKILIRLIVLKPGANDTFVYGWDKITKLKNIGEKKTIEL